MSTVSMSKEDAFRVDLADFHQYVSELTVDSYGIFNENSLLLLNSRLRELSLRYDFITPAAEARYYKAIYGHDTRSGEAWDFYDYLSWLEQNATPEYMSFIFKWMVYEDLDPNPKRIYDNELLLPNEKVSLVLLHSMLIKANIKNNETYFYISVIIQGVIVAAAIGMFCVKMARKKEFDWGLVLFILIFSLMLFYTIDDYSNPLYGIG